MCGGGQRGDRHVLSQLELLDRWNCTIGAKFPTALQIRRPKVLILSQRFLTKTVVIILDIDHLSEQKLSTAHHSSDRMFEFGSTGQTRHIKQCQHGRSRLFSVQVLALCGWRRFQRRLQEFCKTPRQNRSDFSSVTNRQAFAPAGSTTHRALMDLL